jgi:hypothetical protein
VEVTGPSLAPVRVSCAYGGPMLADGTYDVIVVDAVAEGDSLHLEATILAGEHKGEMVAVRATGLAVDELDALGMPGTLTVRDGAPSIVLDR